MAQFKNLRTNNVISVKNETTIYLMRHNEQYAELDENGNPVNPVPVVDPHEGAVAFRNKHTGNILWATEPESIRLMKESKQYEEIPSE